MKKTTKLAATAPKMAKSDSTEMRKAILAFELGIPVKHTLQAQALPTDNKTIDITIAINLFILFNILHFLKELNSVDNEPGRSNKGNKSQN